MPRNIADPKLDADTAKQEGTPIRGVASNRRKEVKGALTIKDNTS